MRFRILKCGCVVGSILVQALVPVCPHGNDLCEMQAEPPHIPHDSPARDTFTVTSPAATSGSNVHVGIESAKFGADFRNPRT